MKRKLGDFLELEIINESSYSIGSADNVNQYKKFYLGEGAEEYRGSTHGIRLIEYDEIIDSCLVKACAGGTSVTETSFILEEDRITICCANHLFCISIPELSLLWKKEVDQATAFQIFKINNDFIVHGEMTVTRIDKQGNIIWQFGGRDIFVSIDHKAEFFLESDHIVLHDFNGQKYLINYDGKQL